MKPSLKQEEKQSKPGWRQETSAGSAAAMEWLETGRISMMQRQHHGDVLNKNPLSQMFANAPMTKLVDDHRQPAVEDAKT